MQYIYLTRIKLIILAKNNKAREQNREGKSSFPLALSKFVYTSKFSVYRPLNIGSSN